MRFCSDALHGITGIHDLCHKQQSTCEKHLDLLDVKRANPPLQTDLAEYRKNDHEQPLHVMDEFGKSGTAMALVHASATRLQQLASTTICLAA